MITLVAAVPAWQLITAALIGIALIVVLITAFKLHPFLSLIIGSLAVGLIAGMNLTTLLKSLTSGVGSTLAGVGILIALGAIVGKMLADSGGADTIVDKIVGNASVKSLPWAMALIGAIIGLPMFFEIGLVLLVPVIILVSKRTRQPVMRIGIPALAGLSAMHALVPPHPGPLAALGILNANLGTTLGLGILVAVPTIAVAGPVFAKFAAKWVPVDAPDLFVSDSEDGHSGIAPRKPGFGITLLTVLLPVVLMMGKALVDIFLPKGNAFRHGIDFLGEPLIALLLTALLCLFTLGKTSGMTKKQITDTVGASLPPIAGILLIVGAGGGFKQVLVDTGIGTMLAKAISGSSVSPLLLAWAIAVVIRLATGSATVATITAAGIVAPIVTSLSPTHAALLVLAIGCGSVFFSHVNDAGFWLVKEYFGVSVGQNIKTWSLMETVLSVVGVIFVLLLSLVM